MQLDKLKRLFKTHKEDSLFGRYIHSDNIKPLLEKHANNFSIEVIGQSVLGENIHSIKLGVGKYKVLMWSQMHGNESTTTRAVFDLLNVLAHENDYAKTILKECTIVIIPILSPDGAKAYTRINANQVDLNRDAQNLTQPESIVFKDTYTGFKPDYCFNLHGQRTIFSAGNTSNLATVSFLSPAQDKACTVTDNRQIAMSLINDMNAMLQEELPNQVGVYDDAFNINCVGDTLQSLNIPTILFEAGHYKDDYDREEVRRYIFQSLVVALESIAANTIDKAAHAEYALIPENEKLFYDIIIRNVKLGVSNVDIAVQYVERLIDGELCFVPKIDKIESLKEFYAHRTIEGDDSVVLNSHNEALAVGDELNSVIINGSKYSLLVK